MCVCVFRRARARVCVCVCTCALRIGTCVCIVCMDSTLHFILECQYLHLMFSFEAWCLNTSPFSLLCALRLGSTMRCLLLSYFVYVFLYLTTFLKVIVAFHPMPTLLTLILLNGIFQS